MTASERILAASSTQAQAALARMSAHMEAAVVLLMEQQREDAEEARRAQAWPASNGVSPEK